MDDSALNLKNYIEEISIIQEKNKSDFQGLKKCLRDYDFTEDELEKLETLSVNHKNRAEDLLKSKKLNEAVFSMERAVEINPFSEEFRNKMAQLYLMRAIREGYKKADRDLAHESASISLSLNSNNPIAKSILKEIRKKDEILSGRNHNKLLGPIIGAIAIIALLALYAEREYIIPLFNNYAKGNDQEWVKPPPRETIQFTEQEITPRISSMDDQFEIKIEKSIIAKTNGSFSYTLQGEISAAKETIKTADLDIRFIGTEGKTLYTKTVPLINEEQLVLPGESISVDQFFYIHYLPPDIAGVTLKLSNYSFSKEILAIEEKQPIKVRWETSRPEGVRLEINLKGESSYESYSQSYKNLKIEIINPGITEITGLDIDLIWENNFGEVLFRDGKILIKKDNPPLRNGKERLFYLFTEMPGKINNEEEKQFYISITGIN